MHTLNDISTIEESISNAERRINQLETEFEQLQSNSMSGIDLTQYVGNNNKEWARWKEYYDDYHQAKTNQNELTRKLRETQSLLREKRTKYDALVTNDKNRLTMAVYQLSSLFMRSLNSFEDDTYGTLFAEIGKRANAFMKTITVDDFRGIIAVERSNSDDGVNILLKDVRGEEIKTPNKSLNTTKCISVILALAEYNKEKRGLSCPIILDAPTSSFDAGKEKSFYHSLGTIESQCVVFTKSFLYKESDQAREYIIDKKGLEEISATVYRIRKQEEGFDQQDLSTIETIIETINTTTT